jgi:hypothetical protein
MVAMFGGKHAPNTIAANEIRFVSVPPNGRHDFKYKPDYQKNIADVLSSLVLRSVIS